MHSLTLDPKESAKLAGLRYVSDESPGIRRLKAGRGFRYARPDGTTVRSPAELARIRSLVIPPAWTEVWICPAANGHVQATGRDARGRKQYRYHPRWAAVRDETKYGKMIAFGEKLPFIRRRVAKDLGLPGLPRDKVLATVVRFLETSLIRVGNEEYARENHSFGLTTMRNHHADVTGATVRFSFRGKSGVRHHVEVEDPRLAAIVRKCQDLPGQELFEYVDDEGFTRPVRSDDVNEYLGRVAGEAFTAKDFRTWAGTVLAAQALRELEAFDSKARAKKNLVHAIESVAKMLGNTRTVCRKCYVHPAIVEAYLDGTLAASRWTRAQRVLRRSISRLRPEEALVLALLQRKLRRAAAGKGSVTRSAPAFRRAA